MSHACTSLVASPGQRAFTLGVSVADSVEVATILLTDLVGYTSGHLVAPVRTDQLRRERYRGARECRMDARRSWRWR